jgi:hypothetical protein
MPSKDEIEAAAKALTEHDRVVYGGSPYDDEHMDKTLREVYDTMAEAALTAAERCRRESFNRTQAQEVAGAVSGVFMRKFPDLVMPTDEVLEAVDAVIGEARSQGECGPVPCSDCDDREEWCGRKPCPNFHGQPETDQQTSDGGSGSGNAQNPDGESEDRASVDASAADPPDRASMPPPSVDIPDEAVEAALAVQRECGEAHEVEDGERCESCETIMKWTLQAAYPAIWAQVLAERGDWMPTEEAWKQEWENKNARSWEHREAEIRATVLAEARERVEAVIQGNVGRPVKLPPQGMDEWGPECAGCGESEFRIDGFYTIECRDRYEFAYEILAAIEGSSDEEV